VFAGVDVKIISLFIVASDICISFGIHKLMMGCSPLLRIQTL
jgi:hypothetical protein